MTHGNVGEQDKCLFELFKVGISVECLLPLSFQTVTNGLSAWPSVFSVGMFTSIDLGQEHPVGTPNVIV